MLANLPLEFSPGKSGKYGVSVDLPGRLVEVWSGQSYESFVREHILVPLAIEDTDFLCTSRKVRSLGNPLTGRRYGPTPTAVWSGKRSQ